MHTQASFEKSGLPLPTRESIPHFPSGQRFASLLAGVASAPNPPLPGVCRLNEVPVPHASLPPGVFTFPGVATFTPPSGSEKAPENCRPSLDGVAAGGKRMLPCMAANNRSPPYNAHRATQDYRLRARSNCSYA